MISTADCVGLILGFSLVVVRAGLALVGKTRPFLAVVVEGSLGEAVEDSATADDDSDVTAVGVVLLGAGVNK